MFIPWWGLILAGVLLWKLFSDLYLLKRDVPMLQAQINQLRAEVDVLTQEREKRRRDPQGRLIEEESI